MTNELPNLQHIAHAYINLIIVVNKFIVTEDGFYCVVAGVNVLSTRHFKAFTWVGTYILVLMISDG